MTQTSSRLIGAGLTRRQSLFGGLAATSLLSACAPGGPAAPGNNGNILVVAQSGEPPTLNPGINSAGAVSFTASKIFDGLLTFDLDGSPLPQLAERWETAPDGLSITLHIRPGVRWHDGHSLSSLDVAWSLLNVWKIYHGRGRTTYANVTDVETPDPLTAIIRLSQPAPYLLSCLAAHESPVLPRHLYEGADVLTNPHNQAPVGSGPFRLVTWRRGTEIILERNPDYWDAPKPYIDGVTIRFLPDAASTALTLESGGVDLASGLGLSDLERLANHPSLVVQTESRSYSPHYTQFEFNLDRPTLRDVRVRQAFAHGIDRDFIARHIHGAAEPATSPIPSQQIAFHSKDIPAYPFDLDRANALLDQAGLSRGVDGVRTRINLDFNASSANHRVAQHIRSTLAGAGIDIQPRGQDQGEYINRVYTRRDFDTCMTGSGAGMDPAIGVQRYYWSRNFQPGVAFSNGANYSNPEVDRLLEEAQTELNPARRHALYLDFQRIAMTDLPYIPLAYLSTVAVSSHRVENLLTDLCGMNGNFADVRLRSVSA